MPPSAAARYLGSLPDCVTCLHTTQLAAGMHQIRTPLQGEPSKRERSSLISVFVSTVVINPEIIWFQVCNRESPFHCCDAPAGFAVLGQPSREEGHQKVLESGTTVTSLVPPPPYPFAPCLVMIAAKQLHSSIVP